MKEEEKKSRRRRRRRRESNEWKIFHKMLLMKKDERGESVFSPLIKLIGWK